MVGQLQRQRMRQFLAHLDRQRGSNYLYCACRSSYKSGYGDHHRDFCYRHYQGCLNNHYDYFPGTSGYFGRDQSRSSNVAGCLRNCKSYRGC